MTEDELALRRTCIDHPEADLPRLVLADYLEETGRADHAEFVRLHIDLHRMDPFDDVRDDAEDAPRPGPFPEEPNDRMPKPDYAGAVARFNTLAWLWPFGEFPRPNRGDTAWSHFNCYSEYHGVRLSVRRGMVEEITCNLTDLVGGPHRSVQDDRVDDLFRTHPVRQVRVPEVVPAHHGRWRSLVAERGSDSQIFVRLDNWIPWCVARNLTGPYFTDEYPDGMIREGFVRFRFESSDAARASLSDACVAHGRWRAFKWR